MYRNLTEMQAQRHASLSVFYSAPVTSSRLGKAGPFEFTPRREDVTVRLAPIPGGARSRWDCWERLAQPDHVLSRPFDVILATLLIIGFLPVFLMIVVAIWLDDPGPALFAQRRVGRNGRYFPCFKFRSMHVGAEQQLEQILRDDHVLRSQWDRDHKLAADPRVTRVGKVLRVTSLDELPQLFNVLRGEMSIVGPRPIVPAEIRRYGRYIHHYYAVRPGLTGLWQVSGRSSVTYRRRIAADIKYARARTLVLDAKILAATLPAVALGRGSC